MLRNLVLLGVVVTLLFVVYGADAIWFLWPVGTIAWVAGHFWLARQQQRRGVVIMFLRR